MANINKNISSERMYKDLSAIASFGPRSPGAPGDKSSLDYLLSFAETENIKVHREDCDTIMFVPQKCRLQTLSPTSKNIKCLPQDRSGSAQSGGIASDIIYVGCGRAEDYEGVCAEGKLLLMDLGGLHVQKKVDNAFSRKAAGCIFIHPHPGNIRSAWGLGEFPSPGPVVSVSYEDGQWLRELSMSDGCSALLECDIINEPVVSEHIIMELPSKFGESRKAIILIAHRDTTHISPGANDNASGMAVLLELIRAFKNHSLGFSLLFIFSAAEEGGGIGVTQLVKKYSVKKPFNPLAVINLDMIAVGSKMRIVKGDKLRSTDTRLNNMLKDAGNMLNYHLAEYEMDIGLADIEPFVETGVPSAWLFKPDDKHLHTAYDVPENVNPNDLKVAADIVANTLINYKDSNSLKNTLSRRLINGEDSSENTKYQEL